LKSLRYIFIFIVILVAQSSFSQNFGDKEFYLIDSLNIDELSTDDSILIFGALQKYHSATEEIEKVKSLGVITEGMMHRDWVKYNYFVKELVENNLSQELNPDLKKRYQHSLATAINNMGINYNQEGQISKALECFHKSLKIQEDIKDQDGTATTLNNIGAIYNFQGDLEKTLDYMLRSLKIREEIGDQKGIAQSLNNIGSTYYKQTDNPKALSYFKKSLLLYEKIGDKSGEAYALSNIGNVYDRESTVLGLNYHQRSLKIREDIGDKQGQAYALFNIGESLYKRGDFENALFYAKKSLLLAKEMNYPDNINRAVKLLSKLYRKSKDYKNGWKMYELHIALRDSLINEKNKDAAAKLDAKYSYEKEEAIKDAEHKKQLEIVAEREQKQKIISYSISGGFVLALVFGFFFMNRLRVTRKQKIVIESQKKIVDQKNQEITDSITYAKRIQDAILPPSIDLNKSLKEGFVYYKPKDIVAGDFYWLEKVGDIVLYAAADCTGHGVPGAMVSVVCNNALNRAVREYELINPALILDKVRELVIETFEKSNEQVKDGMDIALCSINFKTNKLQFSGANNPIYIIRNGVVLETKGDKQSIGNFSGLTPYTLHEIDIESGDSIYTFTDGYPDQFGGPKGKKLKYKPFKELLLSMSSKSMDEQHTVLSEAFDSWKGEMEQIDDVCVIGVRI
jgi:serine phosphatase RsbU (regulator of sigma subunit)